MSLFHKWPQIYFLMSIYLKNRSEMRGSFMSEKSRYLRKSEILGIKIPRGLKIPNSENENLESKKIPSPWYPEKAVKSTLTISKKYLRFLLNLVLCSLSSVSVTGLLGSIPEIFWPFLTIDIQFVRPRPFLNGTFKLFSGFN